MEQKVQKAVFANCVIVSKPSGESWRGSLDSPWNPAQPPETQAPWEGFCKDERDEACHQGAHGLGRMTRQPRRTNIK